MANNSIGRLRKIGVVAVAILCLSAAMIIPKHLETEAKTQEPEYIPSMIGLDYGFIYNVTKNLSYTIFDYPKGRDFGTKGEINASKYIQNIMKDDIGLWNAHKEEIKEKWGILDTWGLLKDPFVCDYLNKKRVVTDCYLNVTIKRVSDGTIVDHKNMTLEDGTCFPLLKRPWGDHNVTEHNLTVVKEFKPLCPRNQIVLLKANWAPDPYAWYQYWRPYWLALRLKGFILMDCFPKTRFMAPSFFDHLGPTASYLKPGFSINGSDGNWIRNYLNDSNYEVKADICSKWKYENVTSYNVIGQINGTDTSTVSIICAHYDCWWNQGTIDEAAETTLVLGIAKYMKKLEDKGIKPKHTVKFIAFGGEEHGFRGSKDYIKKHIINGDEEVRYVINPGNFGHYDRNYTEDGEVIEIPFNVSMDLSAPGSCKLKKMIYDIAECLGYTEETGINFGVDANVEGEDSEPFYKTNNANNVFQFSRWPYKGYHRDGNDHNKGDVIDILDNKSFRPECEMVAAVALHLTMDPGQRFESCSFTTFDKDGNGKDDSVNANFTLAADIPTWVKVKGCLYDKLGCPVILSLNRTDFLTIPEDETASGHLTFTLPPTRLPGEYELRLELLDLENDTVDWRNETFYLYPSTNSIANFIYTPSTPTDLDEIQFQDESISNGSITSWTWDFGDRNTSTFQNPTHKYGNDGTYTVTLTITDDNSKSDTKSKEIVVRNVAPTANFSWQQQFILPGDEVQFIDQSSDSDGNIESYEWDFGDGTLTFPEKNPIHIYSNSGFYEVELTVTDDDGSKDTRTKTVIVADVYVDDDFDDNLGRHQWDTIQEGINDANDGNMVYVLNGTYHENVLVDKSISLIGKDRDETIVDGGGRGIVVEVTADEVSIDNFTVVNGGYAGIYLSHCSDDSISNCNCFGHSDGITLIDSSCNTVLNCYCYDNSEGILLQGSNYNDIVDCSCHNNNHGIDICGSLYNLIWNCSCYHNHRGIDLESSTNNLIWDCEIYDNSGDGQDVPGGIFLSYSSDNNTILNCEIYNNPGYGIHLLESNYNLICYNNFTNNEVQAFDECLTNIWNCSYPGGGNYWSDYTGKDEYHGPNQDIPGSDGIGDIPYEIPQKNKDCYPLMKL